MSRLLYSAITLALLAAVAVQGYLPKETENVYCVIVPGCFTPKYSYHVEYVEDEGACCKLCADDERCVAWTFKSDYKHCALKDDTRVLVRASGVVTGIKKFEEKEPRLEGNIFEAKIYLGRPAVKKVVVKPVAKRIFPRSTAVARASATATAFASASSNGVPSSAVSVVTPNYMHQSVTGHGSAYGSRSDGYVTYVLSTEKEYGKPPKRAEFYYKEPIVQGDIYALNGRHVPIVINDKEEPGCYKCDGFPCTYNHGMSYQSGDVLVAIEVYDASECCQACRTREGCVSWYIDPKSGLCILNKDLPEPKPLLNSFCGTVV